MASIKDVGLPDATAGILMPALKNNYSVWYGPRADSTQTLEFDGTLVTAQTVEVTYSLSSKTVTVKIEEPATCIPTITSIMNLPSVLGSINVMNGPMRRGEHSTGVSLYGLELDNHFAERTYESRGQVVLHVFRFKFKHTSVVSLKLAED